MSYSVIPHDGTDSSFQWIDGVSSTETKPVFTPLAIQTITSIDALAALAPEWRTLDATLSPRVPFTSPDWLLLWWKHFRRDRILCRDTLSAYAVRDGDGTLVAVVPTMISSRPSIGPLRTRELQFLGADSNVTELRGIICRPDDLGQVTAALGAYFAARERDWDWIQWRGLRATDAPSDWHDHIPGFVTTGTVPNYYLALPDGWDAFKAGLPRNIKESLRKCYNSLQRDGHAFTFDAVADPDAIPAALDRFFALHAQRSDLAGSVPHPNAFAHPTAQAFVRDYAATAATTGAVRVFELRIGGDVVATRVAFLLGREMYLYFSGYDLAWKKYSVMTTLLAEALKWGIANGFTIANLSIGTDVSKTRWRPEVVHYVEGFMVGRSLRSAMAFKLTNDLRRAVRGSISQASTEETQPEAAPANR
ncbi:MAG: GNAT family N-acetyltransferase [Janthinobacterium lividum]